MQICGADQQQRQNNERAQKRTNNIDQYRNAKDHSMLGLLLLFMSLRSPVRQIICGIQLARCHGGSYKEVHEETPVADGELQIIHQVLHFQAAFFLFFLDDQIFLIFVLTALGLQL